MLKPEFVRLYELAVSAMQVHQGTRMYVDCFQEDGRGTVPEKKKCEREAFEVILREHKEGQREEIKKQGIQVKVKIVYHRMQNAAEPDVTCLNI